MFKKLAAISIAVLTIGMPAHADDLKSMSWDQIVAQAKKEGEVRWFNWFNQARFREEVKAFETEYGIRVTIPDGDSKANINKFLAEKDRPQGDIDVFSTSGSELKKLSPETTYYGPLDKLLPEGKKLRYDLEGFKNGGFAAAFWGNQSGIAYDSSRITDADLPRTVEQFSTFIENHPGELGFNVENGGAGPAFIQGIARQFAPDVDYASGTTDAAVEKKFGPAWDWFSKRKDQFVITASNNDSVTRLTSGEFTIVAAWEDVIAALKKRGEIPATVKIYVPDFGMPGGGNVVGIPANAKNKAAALVFIHWLTSAKTQTRFASEFGSVPQNPDADATVALVKVQERRSSFNWAAQPLNDDIKNQFIKNVTLR
ncbi:extracellular solute-binding protein [Agrobacterium larrymoorei]|uniref:Extracellular solute-binding protein n=1 Tax=Agrobacterium larrymoorei TaxID=160699 RepID=A0A4D7DTY8_9HYPH|nr:extracellular solute-binding protein [Agrobacterium larrymoorei]QCJ00946.1 extracellular solute-binding protein [Agrobacterium larrymoorei]QYA10281.1 extracellular solute-binding protein [Agrobacterium larrymoorei]